MRCCCSASPEKRVGVRPAPWETRAAGRGSSPSSLREERFEMKRSMRNPGRGSPSELWVVPTRARRVRADADTGRRLGAAATGGEMKRKKGRRICCCATPCRLRTSLTWAERGSRYAAGATTGGPLARRARTAPTSANRS